MEIPSVKAVIAAESEVKAICSVYTAFDAKVTWLLDGKEAPSHNVKKDANKTPIISNLTVPLGDWKQLGSITCKAEHKCFKTMDKTVIVKGKTSIPHENYRYYN